MKKTNLSHISASGQFGILILLIFVSLLIFSFLGMLIGYLFTGLGIESSVLSDFNNPNTITYLKISQIFQAIGIFIVPPIIALFIFRKDKEDYLKFNSTKLIYIVLSVLIMIISLPIINWLAEFNQAISFPESMAGIETWMHQQEDNALRITKYFLKADSIGVLLLNLFIMALIPAIGEEMLFRGVIQKIFSKMSNNIHIGIWLTAFLFSAIHMQFLTFLPRFFMGALFGYLLVWSGSIWLPIAAHFVNNAMAVISNYLFQNKVIETDLENLEVDNQFYYIVTSSVLVGLLLFYLYKDRITEKAIKD